MAGARNTPPHAGAILAPLDHFALRRAKLAAEQATGGRLSSLPRSGSLSLPLRPTVHSAPPLPPGATTAGVLPRGATTAGAPEMELSIE
jgi:hypothetical protein